MYIFETVENKQRFHSRKTNETMETSYSEGSLTPYAVINERLIRQCIKIEMIPLFDDEQSENVIRRKRRDIQFHEVEWLEMSFQSTLHI